MGASAAPRLLLMALGLALSMASSGSGGGGGKGAPAPDELPALLARADKAMADYDGKDPWAGHTMPGVFEPLSEAILLWSSADGQPAKVALDLNTLGKDLALYSGSGYYNKEEWKALKARIAAQLDRAR